MRISTRQAFLTSIANMQNSQTKLADLQNQLSTGKKLNKPSDDPVAAAQVVKLNRELAQTEKFQDNIDVTQRRLELEETVLDSINTSVTRMRELTIQAGNGTLGDADRKSIATELKGLIDYTAGLMNTQDAQGEYLFAGSKGFTKPYPEDGTGKFSYAGDDGQRMIQIAPDLFVPSNDSGQYLFEAVSDKVTVSVLPPSDTFISDLSVEFEDKFLEFSKNKGDLHMEVLLDSTSATPAYQYQLVDSSGNVLQGPNNLPDVTAGGSETVRTDGLKFTLSAPAASDFDIDFQASGMHKLDVADPAAAQAFFDKYGEVTLTFNGQGRFDLLDADSKPVVLDDQTYINGNDLVVEGFRMSLDAPATGDSVKLGIPLQPLSPVTDVSVNNVSTYSAAVDTHGQFKISYSPATSSYSFEGLKSGATATGLSATDLRNNYGITLTETTPVKENYTITLEVPAKTDTVLRQGTERQNVLDVASELVTVLETPVVGKTERDALSDAIAESIDKFKVVEERNVEARTAIGARINALDDTRTANEDYKLFTQTALSSIEDVDFAEAISELQLEEAVLQAAQASFVRVSELSLFNFIR